jgi:hypothetical protein
MLAKLLSSSLDWILNFFITWRNRQPRDETRPGEGRRLAVEHGVDDATATDSRRGKAHELRQWSTTANRDIARRT